MRFVVQDVHFHALGKRWGDDIRDMRMHGVCHVHHVLTLHPGNLHERGRLALMADDQVDILEIVPHLGDVAQTHGRAVTAAEYDNVLEILLHVALPESANPHLGVRSIDSAGGQIEGAAANRGRDVVEGETQGAQAVQRNLDGDLVISHAAGFGQGYRWERGEFILDLVCEFLQRTFRNVAVKDQADDALPAGHFGDLGPLRTGRKRLDAVDRRFDLVHRQGNVGTRFDFDSDRSDPRGRHGLDRQHIVQRAHLFLDLGDDRLLNLFRRGAGIGDGDLDVVEGNGGPGFSLQTGQRHQAGCEYGEHEQVGGDAIARHIGDRPAWLSGIVVVRAHGPDAAPVRTSMPLVAN